MLIIGELFTEIFFYITTKNFYQRFYVSMLKILPNKFSNIFRAKKETCNNVKIKLHNETKPDGNYIVHDTIPLKNNNNDIIFVKTRTVDPNTSPISANIGTVVIDKNQRELGAYYYQMKPNESIENGYIITNINQRRRGIGELMRLSSLIEFKENNLKAIEIDAFPEGLPFHLKYKFKPNLTLKKDAETLLKEINKKQTVAVYDKEKFKQLSQAISQEKRNVMSKQNQQTVNKFVENYIKQNLHQWRNAKFNIDIPMILTDKMVKQFACFYNKLFKKHGIDYKM